MATTTKSITLCFALLTILLSLHPTASIDSPPPADSPLPDSPPPVHPPSDNSSPPAPPPPASVPSPSPSTSPTPSPSPSSTPSPPGADTPPPSPPPPPPPTSSADDGTKTMNKSNGLSSATKAGIAIGVIAFVVLAALGAFIFKQRKDNVARAQYGSAARRDML